MCMEYELNFRSLMMKIAAVEWDCMLIAISNESYLLLFVTVYSI